MIFSRAFVSVHILLLYMGVRNETISYGHPNETETSKGVCNETDTSLGHPNET